MLGFILIGLWIDVYYIYMKFWLETKFDKRKISNEKG